MTSLGAKFCEFANSVLILVVILGLFPMADNVQAQVTLSEVDMPQITQRKIRKFFKNRSEDQLVTFMDLPISVSSDVELAAYCEHAKTYMIDAPLDVVWTAYVQTDPTQAWSGKMMDFGIMYSENSDEIVYATDHYKQMEEGQICFIGFKIWRGIHKLAASFKVTRVDSTQRYLEFTYMEGGKTGGRQQVHFSETPQGWTRIVHSTKYRSGSKFRDRRLYPHFHTVAIDEFHANMWQGLNLDKTQINEL